MKTVVCIKQVPDTTDVKINPETNTLIREGVDSIINPFDTYAIEEALKIKEQLGGEIIVMTMGPPQAESALREAIALGCDEAVLLTDRNFAGADTWATSYTLARGIKKIGEVDLIICGKQAIDGDTAQVGPGIAEMLDIPCVTYTGKVKEIDEKGFTAYRMTESGHNVIKSPLPALITVVKEINEPRMPSLRGKMNAKKADIERYSAADLACDLESIGQMGSPTVVKKIFAPPVKGKGKIFKGEPEDTALKLAGELKDKGII
ncbi:MAG: electron transfer flavoprotein subunit beta/FixA family protein [Elusimicrobia bacterium]|jgi:electron transfer flavoprotein beta subunit|nr:electron transfer flavoprotein subunit beta/FixA family protein [Elusimicrobiota bacterium]